MEFRIKMHLWNFYIGMFLNFRELHLEWNNGVCEVKIMLKEEWSSRWQQRWLWDTHAFIEKFDLTNNFGIQVQPLELEDSNVSQLSRGAQGVK